MAHQTEKPNQATHANEDNGVRPQEPAKEHETSRNTGIEHEFDLLGGFMQSKNVGLEKLRQSLVPPTSGKRDK
ncbi:hypothetical protein PMZ80_008203 [Knufia obscura]|uniref:Uncharacterized protein n=2 Tax=Knufia TaxID=430999 RepID=A0AAN8ERB9_9EURO|nr:hypothetical protein PMZ80_008203 [Knufia obscura]KAK5957068.1 hypothetical protein OHC33_001437 [Knufia fluminis]